MGESPTVAALRTWSSASYSASVPAAVELLLRARGGRLCTLDRPWVEHDEDGNCWIDFEGIEKHTWTLDRSERHILLIAASLAGAQEVVLGRALLGLDQDTLSLVIDALATAGAGLRQERLSH